MSRPVVAAALSVLLLSTSPSTSAAPLAGAPDAVDETPSRWFVELAGAPVADGGTETALASEKGRFRAAVRAARVAMRERRSFDVLWNGLAVEATRREAAKIARLPGVTAIYPVQTIPIPAVHAVPDLATALAMTGADVVQSELGLTGKGVRVAVMDTGIDLDHPDFFDASGRSRVVAQWDFVGDAFNADPDSPGYDPVPVPDPIADDCNGHGTHVAGIVGASGGAVGVAPEVTFGAYRVFGCDGSTTSDIMLAAMERALRDEMDVLNMSIGAAYQWPQYPTARAADKLVNRGMVVVASIGNSGATGVWSAGAPGVGEKVIGVASYDNSHVELQTFTVSPDDTAIGYTSATAAPAAPTSGSAPLARTGTTTTANDACNAVAPAPGSLAGQIALVRRGTCTFYEKSRNAQAAGAIAVVLYNNAPGLFSPTVAAPSDADPPITIPVVAISNTSGALIDSRLQAGSVTLTWTSQSGTFVNPTGGLVSSFSSYGLPPDLSLKPDLGAPGGLIRSTYPLELGGYATISGTSMASPHVAGAAALLLQARPKTRAPDVRTVLQNTAIPKPWWGNPGLGLLDNVHRQGAGMLRVDDAVLSTATVEPSKIALGESEAGPRTVRLKVKNTGLGPASYALSHVPALSTGPNVFTPGFLTGFANVTFSSATVTVAPGRVGHVDVTIEANAALPDLSLYGGYVVLTPADGGPALRVPYAGLKGDYQSLTAMAPTAVGFPWLVRLVDGTFEGQPPDEIWTYTLADGDVPYVLAHFDYGVRKLLFEVFDASSGRWWFSFVDEDYLGRNETATGFYALPFDGTTSVGKKTFTVPDGTYVIRALALKPLGEAWDPADWETWTSPPFTIARP